MIDEFIEPNDIPVEALAVETPLFLEVNIIHQEREWVLVEDKHSLRRASVPFEALHGETIAEQDFEAGIAYGVAWEDLNFPFISAHALAYELRRHGLQTAADVRNHPRQVERALASAYAPVKQLLFAFIKNM